MWKKMLITPHLMLSRLCTLNLELNKQPEVTCSTLESISFKLHYIILKFRVNSKILHSKAQCIHVNCYQLLRVLHIIAVLLDRNPRNPTVIFMTRKWTAVCITSVQFVEAILTFIDWSEPTFTSLPKSSFYQLSLKSSFKAFHCAHHSKYSQNWTS